MKVYKIRHKPSGLYFKPARYDGPNTGRFGKVYAKRPSLVYVQGGYRLPSDDHTQEHRSYKPGEWEVVEFEAVETGGGCQSSSD